MEPSKPLHMILLAGFIICEALAAGLPPTLLPEPNRLRLAALGWCFFGLAQVW